MKDTSLDAHILSVIRNHEIREQSDLQEMLKQRGHAIPQASLSRRLKKLKIAKLGGVYQVIEVTQTNLPIVLDIQVSEFGLIVMHTHPGSASSLAYYIDQKYVSYHAQNPSGVLGTIAGDDTVLVIVKSREDVSIVLAKLLEDFPYLPSNR